jgi:hypothetical protein
MLMYKHLRIPLFISPSALKVFDSNIEDYYLRYLCSDREDRTPQNQAMAAGSAFDAYVKHNLAKSLFGSKIVANLEWPGIFESQVESQNRTWGLVNGLDIYNQYVKSGAYGLLLKELEASLTPPRFEFSLEAEIQGVKLFGKPDLYYTHKGGAGVEFDFKVNGWCSQWGMSPMAGFMKLLPEGKVHKECLPTKYREVMVDGYSYLESRNKDWADQLSTYGWMHGNEVGDEFVVAVDQLCCKSQVVRVAQHRSRVGKKHQFGLMERYKKLWSLINSDWFFLELSREDSIAKCQLLQERAKTLRDDPAFRSML